jgi:hypothetical protein
VSRRHDRLAEILLTFLFHQVLVVVEEKTKSLTSAESKVAELKMEAAERVHMSYSYIPVI